MPPPTPDSPASPNSATVQILRERARALASPDPGTASAPSTEKTANLLHILRFEFGEHHLAVERRYVVQVATSFDITPLPATPDSLIGLVNLRGKIFPVYNLLGILGYVEPGITDSHQLLHLRNADIDICILADKVSAAETLSVSALQPPASTAGTQAAEFIRGITADQLVLVDVATILGSTAIVIQQ